MPATGTEMPPLVAASKDQRQATMIPTGRHSKADAAPFVALAMHGDECNLPGGPSIRVPRTLRALRRIGIDAAEFGSRFARPDIVHLFNVWPAASAMDLACGLSRAAVPLVLSPIFMNLSNFDQYAHVVPALYETRTGAALDAGLAEISARLAEQAGQPLRDPFPGYHRKVCAIVRLASHVILVSNFERRCLEAIGALADRSATVVRNPVNADVLENADPDLFRAAFGIGDYVLQVGRIEPRKNQLLTAVACRRLGVTAVFIGAEADLPYAAHLRRIAGAHALFVPRLEHSDPLFASAVCGASAFCLPSWAEGAPLAALEAGAAGVPLVLSDRAGEREYFGDHADYVCPADLPAMMDAIRKALVGAADAPARAARTAHIRSSFPWDAHARGTAAVYRAVLAEHPARRAHANRLFSFPDRMSLNAYMRRHIPFLRTSASAM